MADYSEAELNRRRANCQWPLTLDLGSRRAFADRQEKLIRNRLWPVEHWYSDEDFCRAYNTAVMLADEVARLRAKYEPAPDVFSYDESYQNRSSGGE
jgi:hypothetical protein